MNAAWDPRRLISEEKVGWRIVIAAVAAYVVITAIVAMHHEPWRDEADPWLYARDADWITIVERSRYAGFPALWFLCLAPLAKIGLPYGSQAVLHLLLSTAAVALIVARAPLTLLTKVLLAASYFFSYEYAIIVRSYALSVLLIFIAAAMHRHRDARPIAYACVLFLLANVNAQGFFVAGTLAALYVLERLRGVAQTLLSVPAQAGVPVPHLTATLIMALGGLLAWLQVRTPADAARHAMRHILQPEAFRAAVSNGFFPTAPDTIGFIAGMSLILLLTVALRGSRGALFVFWIVVAGLAFVYAFIWYGGLRHAGFILVMAIAAIWIGYEAVDRRFATGAALLLNVSLLFSTGVAARYWLLDFRAAFSGAKEMAEFIGDHQLDRLDIAAHNLTQCEAVLPYFPGKRFWYAGLGAYGSYIKWDAEMERALDVPYPVAERRAIQHFDGRPWLLLFNVEMPNPPAHGFRLLYTNQQPIFEKTDERFWLYEPIQSRSRNEASRPE